MDDLTLAELEYLKRLCEAEGRVIDMIMTRIPQLRVSVARAQAAALAYKLELLMAERRKADGKTETVRTDTQKDSAGD
jgi:hypothetical protein